MKSNSLNQKTFKNAIVSVSDKTGLVDFLKPFVAKGLRIVSTGGTYKHLKEAGFEVIDISEQTGFPEVLDGRVKTLHPRVHMAVLAKIDEPEHLQVLKENKIDLFDLVICNLYPFEKTLEKKAPFDELIENIDIGGPTLLRAASKNFHHVSVLCDPQDYSWVQQKTLSEEGLGLESRKKLAARVFSHVSGYDSVIAETLKTFLEGDQKEDDLISMAGRKVQSLRYGENPQQKSVWYSRRGEFEGLHKSRIIQGKELSYNNLLDLDSAVQLVQQFQGPAAVSVKHNNPCGVGHDQDSLRALQKSLQADPVSVFGGIVAVNFEIQASHASLLSELFLECVIAPQISPEAVDIFSKKKNMRILEWPGLLSFKQDQEIKSIMGGFLIQDKDRITEGQDSAWKIYGEISDTSIREDLCFGEKVCAALKSNAIAIVAQGQTLGLGMGQVNRVDAVDQAIQRWKSHHPQAVNPVLISDAFFPFKDSIELIAKSGIKTILQPGGSMRDQEVIAAALQFGITLVMTGQRHFRH